MEYNRRGLAGVVVVVVGGGSRSMTEGYNRLELLCATEWGMKTGHRAKRSQNFCGTVKDISAAPGGRRIWSRLGRFVDI